MIWQLVILFFMTLAIQISCHHMPSDLYGYQYNPYSYGYDVEDSYGNQQWKQEKSINPMEVHGSYGYKDNNGIYREVVYVADKDGFRANVKTNEPGLAGTKDPAGVKMETYHSSPVYSTNKLANPTYNSGYYNVKRRA